MTTACLHQLQTLDEVAIACGIQRKRIEKFAGAADQSALYKVLLIPKRSRKRPRDFRTVHKARSTVLANFHRSIAMIVVNSANFGSHVQGFVKKRSTCTNARRHLGAKQLLHADIVGFFDAITTDHVQQALLIAGSPPDVANTLARACTIDGYLRQGTRCAPALANLVCQGLDEKMLALAKSHGAVYTRYADDMTFSGDRVPSSDAVNFILTQQGFVLRGGRCFLQKRGRNQYVTGLTIADSTGPRLPRRLKRRLRLTLHYIEKYGFRSYRARTGKAGYTRSKLQGMLDYANSIEPDLAAKWYGQLLQGSNK
jgi:hypothetical protein